MASYEPIKKPSFQPPQHSQPSKQQHHQVPPPQQKKGQSLEEMEISRKNAERLGDHIVNFSKSAPTPAIQSKSTTEKLGDNNEQETEAVETEVVKTSNTPSTPETPKDSNNQENPEGINEGTTSPETSIWLQRSQNLVLQQQQQKQALLAQMGERYQRFQAVGSNLYSPETTSQLQSENLTGEEVRLENIEPSQISSTPSTPEQNDSGASIQTKCDVCEAKEKEETSEVQAKLTVGQPGDKYETEADTTAAEVVKQINSPATEESVSEKVEPVDQPTVMRHGGEQGGGVDSGVEQNIQGAKGSGQELSEKIKEPMEQAFGSDFSQVKVHTDGNANQLNRSLNSRAFATGQDIFFKQGEYNPENTSGQELIAHELTHVVQQNGSKVQRKSDNEQQDISSKANQELGKAETTEDTKETEVQSLKQPSPQNPTQPQQEENLQPAEVQPQLENKLPAAVNNQIENKLNKSTAKLPQLEN
ncbi:MAG: DUF4157 domain-containing protein, partial [Spirulinaceae cyanobacterium]